MTEKDKIRAEIERIMAEEMTLFEESLKEGDAETSTSPIVYTRMQMLLSFIDSLQEDTPFLTKENSTPLSGGGRGVYFKQEEQPKANGKEEPVSIDFEQELYKAFGQVKDFTLCMRIAKWFYDMGKNSQDPVSEELEEAAKKHSMVSFEGHVVDDWVVEDFKAGANWQKKQVIEKAVEFFENDLCCYIKAQCFTIEHGRLENDFRKHIEGD